MELQFLKCFHTLASTKSFTKTSKLLYLSQPAVSHQIKMLENSMGHKLFERSNRKVELTKHGHLLFKHCNEIFSIIDRINNDFKNESDTVAGQITIATLQGLATTWLIPKIKKFHKKHNKVSFSMKLGSLDETKKALSRSECDMIISLGAIEDITIKNHFLFLEELVLVAGKKHPLNEAKNIKQVLSYPFCGFKLDDESISRWINTNFKTKSKSVSIGVSVNNHQAMRDFLVTGDYLAVMPLHAIQRYVNKKELKIIHGPSDCKGTEIYLCVKEHSLQEKKIALLVDFLLKEHEKSQQ